MTRTSPQPVIRAAGPADLEPVAAIFAHYVTTTETTFEEVPPAAADWQRRLDDLAGRNLPFLVAEDDGTICGFAYASPWRPKPAYRHTVEDTVYVSPARTGRGLGRALLGALLIGCEQAGARQVIAVIADIGQRRLGGAAPPPRLRARRAARTRVGRKHERWIDTVLMQRDRGRTREYPVHRPRGAPLAGPAGEAAGRGAPGTRHQAAERGTATTPRSDN